MTNSPGKRRRQLLRLFEQQKGLCHYCKSEMVIMPVGHIQEKNSPPNRATLEHLDHKLDPNRGKHNGECRRVAACWKCNNEKGDEYIKKLMVENPHVIWRRTGTRPLYFIDIWENYYRGWEPRGLRLIIPKAEHTRAAGSH